MNRDTSRRAVLAAGAAAGAAGLGGGAPSARAETPFADAEAVRATIQEWTEKLQEQDYAHWISYWTEDALLMPAGDPRVEGHAALVSYARKNFPTTESFAFSNWRIEGEGGLAVVTNNIEWAGQTLKQIIVLRRVAEAWKIQIVMFNDGVAS